MDIGLYLRSFTQLIFNSFEVKEILIIKYQILHSLIYQVTSQVTSLAREIRESINIQFTFKIHN